MSAATRRPVDNRRVSTPSRKRSPYRTRSYSSEVDETLFGTPARYNAQKDTPRIYPEDVTWDPPWVTSPKKTGAPLLWSPFAPEGTESVNSARKSARNTTPRTPSTPKNKYRPKKQVPSYVDETLFGTPLKTRALKGPWATATHDDETSLHNNQTAATAVWSSSPPQLTEEGANLGTPLTDRLMPQSGGKTGSMYYTPVIKQRLGSTITTPQSQGRVRLPRKENRTSAPNAQQKLDFCVENGPNNSSEEHDPDAILQRALKLAGISRNNGQHRHRSNSLDGLSSRASTPGSYFWKRPTSLASSTGRPATGQSGQFSRRSTASKTELQVDDLFSATGARIPLSARGTPRRPDSARTANTEDSVPGLDLTRPSKIYGMRTPRSARSAMSTQSSMLNRPSWKP